MNASQRLDYRAIAPMGVKALDELYGYVFKSGLPRRLVDLVYLRISQLNGCAYCIGVHSRELLERGLPVEHLVLLPIWREAAALFDESERAALAWAETVTRLGERGVSDDEYQAAAAVFGDRPLVDLSLAIAVMNAYNRLSIPFRTTPAAVATHSSVAP